MAATRTQIYLTAEQRSRLDSLRRQRGQTLAELVREAIDSYLDAPEVEPGRAVEATFGTMPDLTVPSRDEWDRG